MKQIRLRLEVTAEDAVPIEAAQRLLRDMLNKRGTESMGTPEEAEADVPPPRVFWETVEVKQGGTRQEAAEAPRRKPAK